MEHRVSTYRSLALDFANPRPEQIDIEDISLGLCGESRFNNQYGFTLSPNTYTVAQHSIYASLLVPPGYALYALLHDASEAYMRDIATPLKTLLPEYRKIEEKVQGAIFQRFGLPARIPEEARAWVKRVDLRLLLTERNALFSEAQCVASSKLDWPGKGLEPYRFLRLERFAPQAVHSQFLQRYASIVEDKPFIFLRDMWQAQVDGTFEGAQPMEAPSSWAAPRCA